MSLRELQLALDEGRVSDLRAILVGLDAEERELLVAEIGEESHERVYAAAVRRARGPKRGRVILLHGIMGADLDVQRGGDRDSVWIHYLRLFNGRLKDLRLKPDGTPRDPAAEVLVRGQNKKYYLPPLLELENHWHARAYAYDWRLDIRQSADLLARLVQSFGQGEPVHLVAHSMGGLVARAFILRHPELWARCDDPDGHRRGGRLVMLGTPNHGAYTIPLVLTGEESKVKALAMIDRKHSTADVLKIVNSFPGSYQMLPSPLEAFADDRDRLYAAETWGNLPVHARHLDDARRFHESLRPVVDGERFVYVAGTDQETPAAVEVRGRKQLRFAYTRAGDGRVTHELGLLPGVRTFYVVQAHGNLPIDADVLSALHELLSTGSTSRLDSRPTVRRGGLGPFVEPVEEPPAELQALVAKDAGRGPTGKSRLTEAEQLRVEGLLLDDPVEVRGGAESSEPGPAARRGRAGKQGRPATLRIDVVWGDVTKVRADVYAVGHYQGVLPQYAELALDAALSGTDDPEQQVLRQHSLRGHLRGALGDIDFFPWPGGANTRSVAVAGMGAPGSFTPEALRFLVRKLVWAVANQPRAATIATVLIGSGEGTLSMRSAIRAYLQGIRAALEGGEVKGRDLRLRFVELYRDRAESIRAELLEAQKEGLNAGLETLTIAGRLGVTAGRRMGALDAFRALAGVVAADAPRGAARKHFNGLLNSVKRREPGMAVALDSALRGFVAAPARGPQAASGSTGSQVKEPIRMSFSLDQGGIRVAAISRTTTVSERILQFDQTLLEELIQDVGENEDASVERLSSLVTRLLLPAEFRDWIATMSGPFVFEVDREMARVHWEMLESDFTSAREGLPLAQRAVVARQLRTTYSAPPAQPLEKRGPIRVLVVGDPGDPALGDDLPGAQEEALEVARFLAGLPDVSVETRIGAPGRRRPGALRGHLAAKRLDVLKELVTGDYDILHYCGHGDFDPEDGQRAGWVFSEGLITSREIARVESPPPLVVANACLSARTSRAGGAGRADGSVVRRGLESRLLPSLADEFFRRGVRNYVGTAWTVSDLGAVLFAQTFYDTLLSGAGSTVGAAVKAARVALYEARADFGGLWSAYQHYGDPNGFVRH